MFLRAGLLSLALLLASRLLGLLRESALAAAFGATGLGDVAVLMLTLPDWLAGVLASGALAYVLLPAWAGQAPQAVAWSQRRLAGWLAAAGLAAALGLLLAPGPVLGLLAPGLGVALQGEARLALACSALAFPLALLASLWVTRLQHERDFTGMYGANLVVNGALILSLALVAFARLGPAAAVLALGGGLLAAMLLRLVWLGARLPRLPLAPRPAGMALPRLPLWIWAALAAGLPLALPFAARSAASAAGDGSLATFNYAWKLVELPLMLAIQLVATLAFPGIAAACADTRPEGRAALAAAVRPALALAWALACAAAAGLLVAAPAVAGLLFGWGRMDAQALARVAEWGRIGAWGLLPQALMAVGLNVLASRGAMHAAVLAYGLALAALLAAASSGLSGGAALMGLMNALLAGVAAVLAWFLRDLRACLPWRALGAAGLLLAALAGAMRLAGELPGGPVLQLAAACLAAVLVLAGTAWASPDLRR